MKKTQKRAFILNECKSPYISQAIFILKDGVSSNHIGVVADAERIVASYMSESYKDSNQKKNQLPLPLSMTLTALVTSALCAAFFLYILR